MRTLLRWIGPPKQLGGRIRWLFLLFAMFNFVALIPRLVSAVESPVPARVAAGLTVACMAVYWLSCYRRLWFTTWAIPLEGLAFAVIGYGLHDWVGSVGLLFAAVSFRGLFGNWRQVLALTVAVFAGSFAAVAATAPEAIAGFLQQAAGVPPLAIFTAAVAVSTGRQERASARERLLSEAGARLAATSDRETVCQISADTAANMLADVAAGQTSGWTAGWAAISLVTEDGERVMALAGAAPVDLLDDPVRVDDMPAQIAAAYQTRGVYADDSGYSLRRGRRLFIALSTERHRYGTLIVGADPAVPGEVQASIEALAAQTTLGMVNAEYAADLRHQAFHDPLTGLANRSLLRDRIGQAINRARRGSPTAVLLLDLDGFKQINDVHGHAAGDHLLAAVAQRLRDAVRGADTAARLGGDEFAVLLDGMDAEDDANLVASRLLADIQAPLRFGEHELHPRGSIGVAIWREHDTDALLHDADLAMYAAKTAGKGRVAYLDPTGRAELLPARQATRDDPGVRR